MEPESDKTLAEGDVGDFSLEQPKVDESLTEGSVAPLDCDDVKVSDTGELDLNGENGGNGGDDLVVTQRIVETQVTVEKVVGVEDDKENGQESYSALEKDKVPLNVESQGAVDGSENIGVENGVDGIENIAANDKLQSQELDRVDGLENITANDKLQSQELDWVDGIENISINDKLQSQELNRVDGIKNIAADDNPQSQELDRVDGIENIAVDDKPQSQEKGLDNEHDDDDGDKFDDIGDKDHDYHVGDFVWGKIRSHPWWPGQIFDPLDASDYALKLKAKNRLLVAYFGDGSFSWCHASQLKPFVENFDEMSKQSTSKNFVYALEEALDEIGRLVELETSRLYIPEANQNQVVVHRVNAGIRAEAKVPEGRIGKMLISQYEPTDLIEMMRDMAPMNSFKGLLKFFVLKSWLSSLYFARGGYKLCSYGEPRNIEGLEDNDNSSIVDVPIQVEEELVEKTPRRVPENSDDKIFQRRKQKSVADLMKDKTDVSDTSASAKKKRGRKKKDVASESGKKKMKVSDKMTKADLTLALTSESSAEKDDDDDDDDDDGDVKSKDETVKSYLSREKKKSRYLSPPYTDIKWGNKNSNSDKDSKRDSEKISKIPQVGARMSKAASQLIGGSPSILKLCVEKSLEKPRSEKGPKTYKSDQMSNINLIEIGSTLNEVLHEIRSAAVDPLCLMEDKNLEMMKNFFSVYRDSVFKNGSNYKIFNKGQSGKKRKSMNTEEVALEVNNGSKKKKMKQASSADAWGTDGSYRKDSPALLVTFPPGFTLPSKDEIIKKFSQFGALNEEETDVSYNSLCARLVFINSSDAEEAFNVSVEKNPFGTANVNFRLRYPSALKEKDPVKSASQSDDEGSKLGFVKQKLEGIAKMVEDSGTDISKDLKSKLEEEMKGLLEKVSEMES